MYDMQRWEYLFIQCQIHKDKYHARWANGIELREWHSLPIHEFSNQAGEKGWELVNYAYRESYPPTLIFKRPKLIAS